MADERRRGVGHRSRCRARSRGPGDRAARRAARGLVRDFGEVENLQVSMKSAGDFVSRADIRAEEVLREELMDRKAVGLCTPKQAKELVQYGVDPEHMYYDEAKELLRELRPNKKPVR